MLTDTELRGIVAVGVFAIAKIGVGRARGLRERPHGVLSWHACVAFSRSSVDAIYSFIMSGLLPFLLDGLRGALKCRAASVTTVSRVA